MHLDKEQRSHNFSTVDLALDLMLIAWPVATGVGLDLSIFLPAGPGFLAALADAVGLFLGYFGLALYVSRMYAAAAIRNRGKGHHRILFPSVGLGLFTGLIGITVVISGYYILADHGLPVFSSILIVLQSILFGFTFGLNYETERRRLDDRYFALPVDQPFDRAFSVLPYLLLTIVFIFPIEVLRLTFRLLANLQSAPSHAGLSFNCACWQPPR